MRCFNRWKGFTLIELLIVVAIIAILAAIAVPNFLEAQTRAKVSRVKSDMRSLVTALESYYVDQESYVPCAVMRHDGKGDLGLPSAAFEKDGAPWGGFFSMLSTPVAYIANSYIPDPFGRELPNNTLGAFNEYVKYLSTNSYTAHMVFGQTKSQGAQVRGAVPPLDSWRNGIWGANMSDKATWFALYSVGPDQEEGQFVRYRDNPPAEDETIKYVEPSSFIKSRRQHGTFASDFYYDDGIGYSEYHPEAMVRVVANMIYDPTNGTKSMGNVWRTGGERMRYQQTTLDVDGGKPWPGNQGWNYGAYMWLFANALSDLSGE